MCNYLVIKQAFSFLCLKTFKKNFFSYLLIFGVTFIVISKQEGYVNILSRLCTHEIIIILYY
jgi:hypothetical protein